MGTPEFLQMLTTQANECATKAGKNTISEAHAAKALDELGFCHYGAVAQAASSTSLEQPADAAVVPHERKRKRSKAKREAVSLGACFALRTRASYELA